MSRYAHLENGLVVNVLLWDGVAPFAVSSGDLHPIDDTPHIGIGWQLVDGEWIAPPDPDTMQE